jgi:two-component system copper resistance phosphate regulon response regulator CusR
MHILVIEDEIKVAAFIKKGLTEQNYSVDIAQNGADGLLLAHDHQYELIVLDIILPGMPGIDVCKKIRQFNNKIPILMLTALGTIEDKVRGLESGADDYLVKPFHFTEFLARIQALKRRRGMILEEKVLVLADIEMNTSAKTVRRNGKEISLTAKEFALLELFLNNRNKLLSRAFIAEAVWGVDHDTGTNVIDVYVNYLRNKIDRGFSPKLIHTIVGMGYILKIEDAEAV